MVFYLLDMAFLRCFRGRREECGGGDGGEETFLHHVPVPRTGLYLPANIDKFIG